MKTKYKILITIVSVILIFVGYQGYQIYKITNSEDFLRDLSKYEPLKDKYEDLDKYLSEDYYNDLKEEGSNTSDSGITSTEGPKTDTITYKEETLTEKEVVSKHLEIIAKLKFNFLTEIDYLTDKVKTEYLSLSSEERSKNKYDMILEYLKLGKDIESKADRDFKDAINNFKSELKEYNYDTAIISYLEDEYYNQKITLKNDIID